MVGVGFRSSVMMPEGNDDSGTSCWETVHFTWGDSRIVDSFGDRGQNIQDGQRSGERKLNL